jgi:DNA-binding CsgD family transcriptional regulator
VSNAAQAYSIDHAAEVGDHRWRELLGQFERLVEHDLARHRGQSTGDGVVATLDLRVTARVLAKGRAGEISLVSGAGADMQERAVQVLNAVPAESIPRAIAGDPVGEIGDLSDRELDVLARVAEGRSNQEIAASLYLSVRTVERHLSNIYAKLRISGKAARAGAAARFSASRPAPARVGR